MPWKVLISAPYMQPVIERFRPIFAEAGIEPVLPPVSERLNEDELLARHRRHRRRHLRRRPLHPPRHAAAPTAQGHLQVGHRHRLHRPGRGCRARHPRLQHPQRLHRARRRLRPRLHPLLRPPHSLDGSRHEARRVGQDPRPSASANAPSASSASATSARPSPAAPPRSA